jgi:RHS repeat-associated protein
MYWDFAGPTVIADTSSLTTRRPWYSMVYNDAVQGLALSPYGMTDASRYQVQHLAGQKQYELTNHLGNVQATISDLPVKVGEAHTEYHAPALPAVYDYYPFGMLMPDRYTSDTSSECVTVSQTKWVTTWVTHCYLAADWVWPAYSYYGTVSVSTSSGLQIAAGESSGIYFEIDVLPYEQQDVYLQTDAFYSGSGTLELQEYHGGQWHMLGSTTFDKLGEVRISIRPREDRIRAVLRGPFYVQVKQFCVQRPQLSQETVLVDICDTDGDKYRFGFNGQEKVNEWAGIGNHLAFANRAYDSRTGRWYSLDPMSAIYPSLSPYQFAGNSPLMFIDPDGRIIRIYYDNGKYYDYTPGVKPTVNNEVVQKVHEAVAVQMTQSPTASWVWTRLHNSEGVIAIEGKVYNFRGEYETNDFKPNANAFGWGAKEKDGRQRIGTITWDYKNILSVGLPGQPSEGYFSPSTVLFHEAAHADEANRVFKSNDPSQLSKLLENWNSETGYDEQYDTKEERRNGEVERQYIKEVNAWQKANAGSKAFYQPLRNHHNATPVGTDGQTDDVNNANPDNKSNKDKSTTPSNQSWEQDSNGGFKIKTP